MKYTFLLISCLWFSIGCSDPYAPHDQGILSGSEQGQRFVVKDQLGTVEALSGEACASGCIWSRYSVDLGVQSPTHSCQDGRCACVEEGNVYASCVADSDSRNPIATAPISTDSWINADADNVVGFECAPGCTWSSYAVTIGAQSKQADCSVGPCACVLGGNVWLTCEPDSGSVSNTPATPRPAPARPTPSTRNERNTDVPYFCQYNNRIEGWATCQNTSIAMMLKKHGWRGTPDDLTSRFGRFTAQSPGGLANVFNLTATAAGLSVRVTPVTNGTISDLRSELLAGRPVIVHGYFTNGHVIVVTGYDGRGYYANDPAGKWNQVFRGGYPSGCYGSEGKGVYYSKAAFEKAVSTAMDGYTTLPIWFHKIR